MALDMNAVFAKKKELDRAADDISLLIRQLEVDKEDYLANWKTLEAFDIVDAINQNIHKLTLVRSNVQEAAICLLKNAEDIQREEEALQNTTDTDNTQG